MKVNASYDSYNDDDDYISVNLDVELEHEAEESAELVKTTFLLVDGDGNCIGGSSYPNDDDIFAEKGESIEVSTYESLYRNKLTTDINDVKVLVDATTFKREFSKLGEHNVPKEFNTSVVAGKVQDIGSVRVYGITLTKGEKPEKKSDDSNIEVFVGLKNIADDHIQTIKIKGALLDSKDSVVEDNYVDVSLPGNASTTASLSLYAKDGKLKGAAIKLSISIFDEIKHYNCESTLSKNKD